MDRGYTITLIDGSNRAQIIDDVSNLNGNFKRAGIHAFKNGSQENPPPREAYVGLVSMENPNGNESRIPIVGTRFPEKGFRPYAEEIKALAKSYGITAK